jgi:hypothetical protein
MLWLALLIVLYGYLESQQIRVRRDRVALEGLPRSLEGFTIIHLSDLHSSRRGRQEKRLCEILRGLEGDLTVFTGDYKRRKTTNPQKVAEVLQEVSSCTRPRFGKVGVLGNKDDRKTAEFVQKAGIELLSGRAKRLKIGDDAVWIAGINAPRFERATGALLSVTSLLPEESFRILISHGPDVTPLASALGYALILCGDTHGGQIRLPLIGAPMVKSKISRHYCWGIVRERGTVLCVSGGIGTCAFPLRLLCPPEVRLLTLTGKRPLAAKEKDSPRRAQRSQG